MGLICSSRPSVTDVIGPLLLLDDVFKVIAHQADQEDQPMA
jgi:hypothetical protein